MKILQLDDDIDDDEKIGDHTNDSCYRPLRRRVSFLKRRLHLTITSPRYSCLRLFHFILLPGGFWNANPLTFYLLRALWPAAENSFDSTDNVSDYLIWTF